jgi:hypothetical protein
MICASVRGAARLPVAFDLPNLRIADLASRAPKYACLAEQRLTWIILLEI